MNPGHLLIETRDLHFAYKGHPVLKGIDLTVPAGSIYGFLGANGAGKSTTIRILLRLLQTETGQVRLFGEDPDRNRIGLFQKIGALIESPSLYPQLSGRDNLEVTRLHRGVTKQRITAVLDLVRLSKDADRPVKHYSMGMKQRLGLALALLHDPELLVLDEPANGLDPDGIAEMRELIITLAKRHGKTVFLSSHLLSEVERTADWVGILKGGKLAVQAPLAELKTAADRLVRVQTSHDQKAVQVLTERSFPTQLLDGGLSVEAATTQAAAEANRHLVEAGLDVYSLSRATDSLETLYFDSTSDER